MNRWQAIAAVVACVGMVEPTMGMSNAERKQKVEEIDRSLLIDAVAEEQVRHPKGRGPYEVVVFTRPRCPWCQKLHAQRGRYAKRGIRIRYAPSGNHESRQRMARIWCAPNRMEAMTRAKKGRELPRCNDGGRAHMEVRRLSQLGWEMGVKGTPSWIMPDGSIVQGLRSAREMADRLRRMVE